MGFDSNVIKILRTGRKYSIFNLKIMNVKSTFPFFEWFTITLRLSFKCGIFEVAKLGEKNDKSQVNFWGKNLRKLPYKQVFSQMQSHTLGGCICWRILSCNEIGGVKVFTDMLASNLRLIVLQPEELWL